MGVQKMDTIRAQIYTCSLTFLGEVFFEMLTVTVTVFNFRGFNYYSIQFEQLKCTLSGSFSVIVFNFWGINLGVHFGPEKRISPGPPKFLADTLPAPPPPPPGRPSPPSWDFQ